MDPCCAASSFSSALPLTAAGGLPRAWPAAMGPGVALQTPTGASGLGRPSAELATALVGQGPRPQLPPPVACVFHRPGQGLQTGAHPSGQEASRQDPSIYHPGWGGEEGDMVTSLATLHAGLRIEAWPRPLPGS